MQYPLLQLLYVIWLQSILFYAIGTLWCGLHLIRIFHKANTTGKKNYITILSSKYFGCSIRQCAFKLRFRLNTVQVQFITILFQWCAFPNSFTVRGLKICHGLLLYGTLFHCTEIGLSINQQLQLTAVLELFINCLYLNIYIYIYMYWELFGLI